MNNKLEKRYGMTINESMEMYLETVYILEERYGHSHVTEIARILNVSKPSVTKAMKYLGEKGFINKEPYGSITLTEKGMERAEKIYKRHKLLTRFLEVSLKMKAEDADRDACRMEHVISEKMIEAIEEYIKKNDSRG